MKVRVLFSPIGIFAFVAMFALGARAQEIGNPGMGTRLDKSVCAQCHLVEIGRPKPTDVGAPPFRDIVAWPDAIEFNLLAFFQAPHRRTPDLHLTLAETDEIIAYLLSLKAR